MTESNVIIILAQEGEHLHSWETRLSDIEGDSLLDDILDIAKSTGFLNSTKTLEYKVYLDSEEGEKETLLMKGEFTPAYLAL